jgi:hypothetical protein
VHVPTCTTIYIDAGGSNETRTIMLAERVAIHTDLNTFDAHEWIVIFTDSLSSLHAIRHTYTNPISGCPRHYHQNSLLLGGITDILEDRRRKGLITTLRKIRAHKIIRGNDLADAAAKLAVTSCESLPPSQTLKVDMGEIAMRPLHWVTYTVKPQVHPPYLGSGPQQGTLRQLWWTMPDTGRL